jgi:hypothetical protein
MWGLHLENCVWTHVITEFFPLLWRSELNPEMSTHFIYAMYTAYFRILRTDILLSSSLRSRLQTAECCNLLARFGTTNTIPCRRNCSNARLKLALAKLLTEQSENLATGTVRIRS